MKRLILIVSAFLAFCPSYGFAITIDSFNNGDVDITSQINPPLHFIAPLVQSEESGLSSDETLGGMRRTWVKAGMDDDPAIAELQNGLMNFTLDNDECRSGLDYDGFGSIDLQNDIGVAFDVTYDSPGQSDYTAAFSNVHLYDSSGAYVSGSVDLGINNAQAVSGTYLFEFDDTLRNALDLSSIIGISFDFWGHTDYAGVFKLDNIYTETAPVPEPSTLLLLGAGFASYLGRRKFLKR